MRLAFCLYKYFPHSGLARDMLRIANEAVGRGHQVDVYAGEWQDEIPAGVKVSVPGMRGWSNHGRVRVFIRRLGGPLREGSYDAVIGFNKMPGLDFYYAADGCFAARARRGRPRAYELTPRYRSWRRLENSVFGAGSRTRILLLSEPSRLEYRAFYATADKRMRLLPPTLDRRHRLASLEPDQRAAIRATLGAAGAETLLLMVGSAFHTKGVDRTLRALAALPDAVRRNTRLAVVGRGKPARYRRLAARLGIEGRIVFAGGRNDVPDLLRAADLLIHPARQENTGTVLLEALAAGLPVITTANCGYALHVRNAGAGVVLDAPFDQLALNQNLAGLLSAPDRSRLSDNARHYAQDNALYRMPETAVDLIENWRDDGSANGLAFSGYVAPGLTGLSRRLPRLEDWLQLKGDVFRRTRDRKTLRFEYEGGGYFLKAHFGAGWKEIFKNLMQLKPPVLDAGNEWRAIHLLGSLGIPTMEAVAWGTGRGLANRRSFIVTRELRGMISLEQYAAQARARDHDEIRRRRRFIRDVANTAHALHGNGINHRDFYLCHFLWHPESGTGEDSAALHLIDLHRAQVRWRTPRRWRIKDIGGLYYSALGAGLTRHERLRFIRAYAGTDSLRPALDDDGFWTRVDRRARALKRAEEKRGYADAAGAAKHFANAAPDQALRRMWTIANDQDRCPLLDEILARPEAVMARGRVLKHDGTTTVVVVDDGERRWVIKRYNTKSPWHAVRRVVRSSRAANCWAAAGWLSQIGIDTPRPVACMEERTLGVLRRRSYLVCDFIDGQTLDHRLRHGQGDQSRLVEQAAGIVLRLRKAGIVHGDMKATNFIVSDGRMYLVDLDATRRVSGRRLAAGLQTDRERFLRNWRDQTELQQQFEKRLGSRS